MAPSASFLGDTMKVEVFVVTSAVARDHDISRIASSGEHVRAGQPIDSAAIVRTVRATEERALVAICWRHNVKRVANLMSARGTAHHQC